MFGSRITKGKRVKIRSITANISTIRIEAGNNEHQKDKEDTAKKRKMIILLHSRDGAVQWN
jgi:hypothetical protein